MNSELVALPEKTYFSVDEISQRWGCTVEQIMHYIDEGLIRPAIKTTEIAGLAPFEIALVTQEAARQGRHFSAHSWSTNRDTASYENVNIIWNLPVWDGAGKFLYIIPKNVVRIHARTVVAVLVDFQFNEFGLIYILEPFSPAKHDISNLIIIGQENPRFPADSQYTWNPATVIVTREERDRFEENHGIRKEPALPLFDYSTPYLDVMHQAISKFFAPRRPVDAKREEVEAWIAERLAAAGTEGSSRIAGAMFTMIKPSDHNPRKRRG